MSTTHTNTGQLEPDCQRILGGLRGALIELFASVDADPGAPQEVSRRFGLNRNLTWKISKIIESIDGFGAIQHLPGAAGWDIFLASVGSAGVPEARLEAVRKWLREFEEFVTLHAGDRTQLELMLDSMGVGSRGEGQLDMSRQLAYQGNSGILGVQAKVRVTAAFVVPSKTDPTRVDCALVGGLVGFRRLRPNVSWPLFRFTHHTDGKPSRPGNVEEIELKRSADEVPRLLRRFCSPNLPQIRTAMLADATEYVLPSGPVGNSGQFSCFFGDVVRGEQRYAKPGDEYCEFGSHITLPVETLVFDLLVHEGLEVALPPAVLVFGRPDGVPYDPRTVRDENLIPLSERAAPLAGRPPAVATPLVPHYAEIVQAVVDRLGFEAGEMRGYRLVLKHPPMNSTVVLRCDLPSKP